MKSHRWNIKPLGRPLTVVEVKVFTYFSIHVRLLRDTMSKNCFILAPLIQLQSADSKNNPCQRFKKRLRHLTVVEVDGGFHYSPVCSNPGRCSIHARLLRNKIYKSCFIYAHMKIQLQSADSKNKPKSTRTPQTFDSGVKVDWGFRSVRMLNTSKTVKRYSF